MERQPHIRLSRAMTQARYALLPGDPQRVEHVARFLEKVEPLGQNREFRALRGWFHGIELLAVSTGIGGASTAIAVEELHRIGITTLIRIGSCGALQDHMAMGDLVIASGAVRDEGTSHAYAPAGYPACADNGLVHLLRTEAGRWRSRRTVAMCAATTAFIPTGRPSWTPNGRRAVFWPPIWKPRR